MYERLACLEENVSSLAVMLSAPSATTLFSLR